MRILCVAGNVRGWSESLAGVRALCVVEAITRGVSGTVRHKMLQVVGEEGSEIDGFGD